MPRTAPLFTISNILNYQRTEISCQSLASQWWFVTVSHQFPPPPSHLLSPSSFTEQDSKIYLHGKKKATEGSKDQSQGDVRKFTAVVLTICQQQITVVFHWLDVLSKNCGDSQQVNICMEVLAPTETDHHIFDKTSLCNGKV